MSLQDLLKPCSRTHNTCSSANTRSPSRMKVAARWWMAQTATTGHPRVGEELVLNGRVYLVEPVRHEQDLDSGSSSRVIASGQGPGLEKEAPCRSMSTTPRRI